MYIYIYMIIHVHHTCLCVHICALFDVSHAPYPMNSRELSPYKRRPHFTQKRTKIRQNDPGTCQLKDIEGTPISQYSWKRNQILGYVWGWAILPTKMRFEWCAEKPFEFGTPFSQTDQSQISFCTWSRAANIPVPVTLRYPAPFQS